MREGEIDCVGTNVKMMEKGPKSARARRLVGAGGAVELGAATDGLVNVLLGVVRCALVLCLLARCLEVVGVGRVVLACDAEGVGAGRDVASALRGGVGKGGGETVKDETSTVGKIGNQTVGGLLHDG